MSGVSLDIWDEPQNAAPARQPNPGRDAHMQPVQQRPQQSAPVSQYQQQARVQQPPMNYQQMPGPVARHQTMAPEPAKMSPALTPQQQQFRPQVYAAPAFSAPPMPPPPFRTPEPIGVPRAVVDPNQDLAPTSPAKCMDIPVWFKILCFSILGFLLIVVFQLNKLINVLEKK